MLPRQSTTAGKRELILPTSGAGSGKSAGAEAKPLELLECRGASSLREQIEAWVSEGGAGGEGNQ